MLKALMWKEWRCQRPLVLAGLGISAILPLFMMAGIMATTTNRNLAQSIDILAPALLLFVWPIMAAATGATTFAADGGESLRFVLSRPVSRGRLWGVKVGTGIGAFFAVVVGSLVIMGGYVSAFGRTPDRTIMRFFDNLFSFETLIILIPFALLFGCALYCSLFIRRPMAAALAGGLAAIGMSTLIGLTWTTFLPSSPRVASFFYGIGVVVGAPMGVAAVFGVALWTFVRGDLDFSRRLDFIKPLAGITLVVMVIGLVPVAYAGLLEISAVTARVGSQLSHSPGTVLLTEPTPSGLTTRIVRADVDDGDLEVIVPKHGALPVMSPDGEWMAYVSFGSYLGILGSRPRLRAARLDGSDDRSISSLRVDWSWGLGRDTLTIAPDNDTVAYFYGGNSLWMTSISEGTARRVDLGIVRGRGWILGWTAQGSKLLYHTIERARTPEAATEVRAYNPRTGQDRLVRRFEGEHNFFLTGTGYSWEADTSGRAWGWRPVWMGRGAEAVLALLNTASGELVEVGHGRPCPYWGFAPDGRFLYGNCIRSFPDNVTELRLFDPVTGADERFASLTGFSTSSSARELFVSPDGERILIYTRNQRGGSRGTWVVERGGEPRELMRGALPVAWINDREVLTRWRIQQAEFFVVDTETGERTVIYESSEER